jgi:hypothetical protein
MTDIFIVSTQTIDEEKPNWNVQIKPMYFLSSVPYTDSPPTCAIENDFPQDFCIQDAVSLLEKVRLNDYHAAMYIEKVEFILNDSPCGDFVSAPYTRKILGNSNLLCY